MLNGISIDDIVSTSAGNLGAVIIVNDGDSLTNYFEEKLYGETSVVKVPAYPSAWGDTKLVLK